MGQTKSDKHQKTLETLRQAILAMQEKIIRYEAEFMGAPLTIKAVMGDGRVVERKNPLVQEYRALVRDYAAALKSYKDLTGQEEAQEEAEALSGIRAKLRLVK